MKQISINMAHMGKWSVTADNIIQYENIINNNGLFSTFYVDAYTNWLNEFNIFYTATLAPISKDIMQ